MDLDLTEDQELLVAMIDRLLAAHTGGERPAEVWLDGAKVEAELDAGGFYDACRGEGDPVSGMLLIERVARALQAVELAGSAFVAPRLGIERAGPIALATGAAGRPARFLDRAATLIVDDGDAVFVFATATLDIAPRDSNYGYPFGAAAAYPFDQAQRIDATVSQFHTLWRVALAAEIAGAAGAALDQTVLHVKDRHQFGHPLGTFQAIQHRLAEGAVAVRSMSLLAALAAQSGSADAAAAAVAFAQQASAQICYDVHQFHGAIGLTLEHPLHFWTMRLRALQSELGGASANACAVDLRRLALHEGSAAAA